jgi:Ca-activated chloride channel family protein
MLALLPLPLLFWWLLPPYREESAAVRLPFFGEVARAAGLTPESGAVVPKTNWLQKILAPLGWALVVLALARPQFVEPPLTKVLPARDLLLALDLSQSMETRDFRAPDGTLVARADAVRTVVDDFVQRRKTDRIGLIVFGDAPYPQAPFTLDRTTVHEMVEGIVPGMAGPRTALGDAIGLAIKLFDQSKAPEKVLIVLTDGNDTASKMAPARAADIARQNRIRIHTVGIGSTEAKGEERLDTGTLQKIAAATGGRYFFGQDQQQLADIYRTLDAITPANEKTLSWRPKRELFHIPLGAALALLLAYQAVMYLYTLVARFRGAGRAAGADGPGQRWAKAHPTESAP